MTDSLPKVSICTAVWNGLDFTRRFIESIKRNESFEYELVIVNNGSDPEVSSYLKEYADQYYRFNKNQGFCKGSNKAADLASSDFLILINNDTILPNENWWQELYEELTQLENCGLIFPCVNNILSPVNKRSQKGDNIIKLPRWELPLASGCVMGVRKDIFQAVGGFDESFGNSGEDLDFQFKIWDAGYDIYITERVFIQHIGKATSSNLKNQRKLWIANYEKFKYKWRHKIKEVERHKRL